MARPGDTGVILSYAQLEGVWIDAAEPRLGRAKAYALAPIMAAIAEAESGGQAGTYNPTDNNGTQTSYGLWQISNGTHSPPSNNWADPSENAILAVGKYQGGGFAPWGTYDSGAYKAYLSPKTTPDFRIPGNPGSRNSQAGASADVGGQQSAAGCLVGFPGLNLSGPLGIGSANVAQFCIISKAQFGRVLGVGLILLGGLILWEPINLMAGAKTASVLLQVIGPGKVAKGLRAVQQAGS